MALDLNQEALDWLLGLEAPPVPPRETWTRGALKRRALDAALIRNPATYRSPDRYRRAVGDLNRALRALSAPAGAEAGLADYREEGRSPLRRADLLAAAADWERSLYRPLYERRMAEVLGGGAGNGGPGSVGISVTYLSQALPAFALVGLLRARWPRLRILLGGGLVTSWLSQGSLAAEDDFGGLVDALLPGRGEDALASFLGIAHPVLDGAPDFDDFTGLRHFAPTRIIPYNFSSGCPWKRCSFCPEKAEDSRYRGARRQDAVGELRGLVERHRPGLLHFMDNEVAPLYLRAMADFPPGAPWYGFARFTPLLGDPAFARRLAASGCLMLQLGLESADQGVLDALGKGIDLPMIERALDALAEAGIAVYLYVLFGTPAEDRDAALRTRDFVAARADRIAFINTAIFNMPVTSPEAALHSTRAFYDGDLSLYCEFRHPAGWDRPELRRFLARDFGSTPEIAAILARNPPVFTSNHAAFFLSRPGASAPPAPPASA